MPIFENACPNQKCERYGKPFEWFAHTRDKPDPECMECGDTTVRMISRFQMTLTGVMTSRYNDKSKEGAHSEGHWMQRVKSTRRPDGKPEPVFLETFEQQREFCKAEGLMNPSDVPRGLRIKEDGRGFESTTGLPGQWI